MQSSRPGLDARLAQAEAARHEGRFEDALAITRQVLDEQDSADARSVRSMALRGMGRQEEALAEIEQAIALDRQQALYPSLRGVLLVDLGRHDDAMACFDRALALHPGHTPTLLVRGLLLHDLGLHRAAKLSYDTALALEPNNWNVRLNRAMQLLQLGEFEEGWREYEWRWSQPAAPPKPIAAPIWDGRALGPRDTLLLHCEQGLGDTIQFSRLATEAARRGTGRVILVVQRPLQELLRTVEGVSEVHVDGEHPTCTHWCPLMSLPLALGLGEAPPWQGPYLHADREKVLAWRSRLPQTPSPRVALVWSGNPIHPRDAQRSIPFARLLDALPPGPQYISLQREFREGEQVLLAEHPGILELGSQLRDFTDTAAICELADLVLTVDTSVAHLSGALGRPTWVMSRFAADWRWQLKRSDSAWYPTVRLFRQDRPLQWDGMLRRVRLELQDWFQVWEPRP